MQGYRTIIVNMLMAIAGIFAVWNIEIPPELIEEVASGIVAIVTLVNIAMRFFTRTPVGEKEDTTFLRSPAIAAVLATALTLAACASSASAQLYAACRSYVGLERTLIVQYTQGRLSDAAYDTIREVGPVARAACSTPVGEPVTSDMLADVERALLRLEAVKGDGA